MLNGNHQVDVQKFRVLKKEKRVILKYLNEKTCDFEAKLDEYDYEQMQNNIKSAEKSKINRYKATEIVEKGNHNGEIHANILKKYNKSVLLAPPGSDSMALALSNRSKFMFHVRKYEESLKDIDRSLKIARFNSLLTELYCRKIECQVAIGMDVDRGLFDKAKHHLNRVRDTDPYRDEVIDMVVKAKVAMEIGQEDPIDKDKSRRLGITNSAVEMNYSKQYERHLIASRDIEPGEIICVEKFYAVTRDPDNKYIYCSQCLTPSWTLIPCDTCNLYMYCSEDCKTKSWNQYHDIECIVTMPITELCTDFEFDCRLALKLLIMAFRETGSINKLRMELEKIDRCQDECARGSSDGRFRSDTFKSVYSLSYPFRFRRLDFLIEKSVIVLMCIAKYTNLLGYASTVVTMKKLAKNRDAVFLAALFLKFSLIVYRNATNVLECCSNIIRKDGRIHLDRTYGESRGQAIAPLTSLLNHSCNPNVYKLYTNDAKIVYYCILPIKKNAQIFESYCPSYNSTMTKAERHQFLAEIYQFECKCEACENNWLSAPVQPDGKLEHLLLKKEDIPQSLRKLIFDNISIYISFLTKNRDPKMTMLSFQPIGRDICILLQSRGIPSAEVETFISLLRLAYEKTFACSAVALPEGNCRVTSIALW